MKTRKTTTGICLKVNRGDAIELVDLVNCTRPETCDAVDALSFKDAKLLLFLLIGYAQGATDQIEKLVEQLAAKR